ncbi:MAG TPA: hypothetical protein VFB52_01620 [Solirubrobacterales bacterium]|nr:hypothetical protein [Solirubrobacterales bacterium]
MSWKLTFLAAVAIVAIAGVAVAATGGGSKDVTICAQKKGGGLSLAPKSGKCGKDAKKLVIAKEGPAGPAGAPGAAGTTASIQPEAVRFVTPPTANGCEANPGSFCGVTSEGGAKWHDWEDWGSVGFQKDAAGYVHLQGGTAFGGSGQTDSRIFFLPPGYRPSAKTQVAATECDGTPISVFIGTNGEVLPHPVNFLCVILDGISFRP